MNALRTRTHIDSDSLHLRDLKQMLGKDVEIIVLEESPDSCPRKRKRTPGSAKGMISMTDDFTAPLPADIAEEFYT